MAISKKSSKAQEPAGEEEDLFGDEAEQAKQVAVTNNTGMQTGAGTVPMVDTGLSADEDDDLEIGFGSFPIITLNKVFECKGADFDIDDSFDCVLQGFRAKYIYKVDDENFFYSYCSGKPNDRNPRLTAKGDPLDAALQEWEDEGLKYSVHKYLEVTAILHGGDVDGTVVLLSISPSSVTRFSGYVKVTVPMTGNTFKQVVTRASKGALIPGKFPFKPWNFAVVK